MVQLKSKKQKFTMYFWHFIDHLKLLYGNKNFFCGKAIYLLSFLYLLYKCIVYVLHTSYIYCKLYKPYNFPKKNLMHHSSKKNVFFLKESLQTSLLNKKALKLNAISKLLICLVNLSRALFSRKTRSFLSCGTY